jgi:Type II CAAX prenyl endopeptidase Rce1-like
VQDESTSIVYGPARVAVQLNAACESLLIWLLTSFSEELYVRGLVQSGVADRDDAPANSSALEPSIESSAFLFAAMHGPLMWSPIGVKGGMAIVLSTLAWDRPVRSCGLEVKASGRPSLVTLSAMSPGYPGELSARSFIA